MSYKSVYSRTDVTAVKLYQNYILAGIGSSVKIFEKQNKALLQVLPCLNGQKIYGFVPSADGRRVLVFGGKQFALLLRVPDEDPVPVNRKVFSSREPVVCSDWLHAALWIDDNSIAVLTAHNVVQKWNLDAQTLEQQFHSPDNSILYSGRLLVLEHDLLVMAGTVFSEVILHVCGEDTPLHRLKGHKGVIFSISCYPEKDVLVTTSDDRSVRIWGANTPPKMTFRSTDYWRNAEILCKHELYGHSARVMRSCITDQYIVSVGEDSQICFWDYNGELVKKMSRHQNGGIWSVDADRDTLVTGGGDCAVAAHPLTLDQHKTDIIHSIDKPKLIAFSARHNLFIINETNSLYYYNFEKRPDILEPIFEFNARSHPLMSLSSCKQICAAAANTSLIVLAETIHNEKPAIIVKMELEQMLTGLQWAGNRHLILGFSSGVILVYTSSNKCNEERTMNLYAEFEAASVRRDAVINAAVTDSTGTRFLISERGSNSLSIYHKGTRQPTTRLHKTHGNNGLTSLIVDNNLVITTGRDRTLKYYSMTDSTLIHTATKELDFPWVETFLDKDRNMICGFKEKMFVVFDLKTNCKLFDVECGGGHRSWDAHRTFQKQGDNYEEIVKLVFLKNSKVNTATFSINSVVSTYFENGSHSKEIISLKTVPIGNESTLFISGGEDTTMRVSLMKKNEFEDLAICKHLSSVRTIKVNVNESDITVLAAGGRAQICIRRIRYTKNNNQINVAVDDAVNFMLKGTDRERRGGQSWTSTPRDLNPETRIMDIDYVKQDDVFTIFAGCSDAALRVFIYDDHFRMINESKYHATCILKTIIIVFGGRNITVTCSTRGEIAFWDPGQVNDSFAPFHTMIANKSGINSFAYKEVGCKLLLVTGGDDNDIHLNVLTASTLTSMTVESTLVLDKHHSSQITGLCLVEDFLLSTSIDQRVTLFCWRLTDHIECSFISQGFSDVADIHGMEILAKSRSSIKVCVFGKGIEVLEMSTET